MLELEALKPFSFDIVAILVFIAQWDYDTNELNNCKNVMIIMKKMNLFRILLQVLQTQAMVGFNINTNKHIIKESFNLKKNNESYELKTKKDLDGRDQLIDTILQE